MDEFGVGIARSVGASIGAVHPEFSQSAFVKTAVDAKSGGWVTRIGDALPAHLPRDFADAIDILLKSLGPEVPPEEPMPDAHSLTPVVYFIAVYGSEHFDLSMNAIHVLSKRTYVAQTGVRRFLIENPDRTMQVLREWVQDPCPHVRRLVVNATRPRLRYGAMPGQTMLRRFQDDPEPVLQLLDKVSNDPSATVRKAVGGSIGDIAKDNPDLAYDRVAQWLAQGGRETRHIARQSLRYGVRKGHPRAIKLQEQAKQR
jgi:3-methyladenine DNA glycosylase AlkC